jgi:pyruvate carboxylase
MKFFSFPNSVIDMMQGGLGVPEGGFPEPLRSDIVGSRETIVGRPGESMESIDFDKIERELQIRHPGLYITREDVMSYAMYPSVTDEYLRFKQKYGRVSGLETRKFLVGPEIGEEFEVVLAPGKTVFFKPLAVTELNASGMFLCSFQVFFERKILSI